MIDIKNQYHIAIDDKGFHLKGSPLSPAYILEPAAVFQNRFAQGDRTYDDFSKWWFMAQTDWFQGFKDDVSWEDDGKYYYSTNIDAFSEVGALKLLNSLGTHNTFTENVICGHEGEVNSSTNKYVGTDDNASNRPVVYKYASGSWSDVSSTNINTSQNIVSQIIDRLNYLWVLTVGTGSTTIVNHYNGTTWSDQTSNITTGASLSFTPQSSRCGVAVGDTLYLAIDNATTDYQAIVKTDVVAPSAAGDWSLVFQKRTDGLIVSMAHLGGTIYYLLKWSNRIELRAFNLTTSADSLVRLFRGTNTDNWGVGDKLLVVQNGKLIITIPPSEVWEYDGVTMSRVWKRDANKNSIGVEAVGHLYYGGVASEDKMYWANLVYDGSHTYDWVKPDSGGGEFYPAFVDGAGIIYGVDSGSPKRLSFVDTSAYKTNPDKNFLVLSNFDKVSGIDKLGYSITILFKKLVADQSIVIEYLTGELDSSSTWTTLGTASYTLDGGTTTEKTFYFPENTVFKKIWLRVKMGSGGSNTPVLKDLVMAYLPRPFADKQWRVNVDCGDEMTLLNGQKESRVGRQLKGQLEQAWIRNRIVDFQDVDYFSTTLTATLVAGATTAAVADTSEAPDAGRIRIGNEVIYYTGKTQKSFTGLLRGQKGTLDEEHASTTAVNNGYKVLIQSIQSRVPILNRERKLEYVCGLILREVV